MSDSINIPHLATLARLSLDEQEVSLAHADLTNIIAMIDAMANVDTEGVEPMAHPLDATQRLRDDVVTETRQYVVVSGAGSNGVITQLARKIIGR